MVSDLETVNALIHPESILQNTVCFQCNRIVNWSTKTTKGL